LSSVFPKGSLSERERRLEHRIGRSKFADLPQRRRDGDKETDPRTVSYVWLIPLIYDNNALFAARAAATPVRPFVARTPGGGAHSSHPGWPGITSERVAKRI